MTHVIASPCIGTKSGECVDVCPVDCIHPKPDAEGFAEAEMLYIERETCIDCGACVSVCPVTAIFAEDDLPENEKEYVQKNIEFFEKNPQFKG